MRWRLVPPPRPRSPCGGGERLCSRSTGRSHGEGSRSGEACAGFLRWRCGALALPGECGVVAVGLPGCNVVTAMGLMPPFRCCRAEPSAAAPGSVTGCTREVLIVRRGSFCSAMAAAATSAAASASSTASAAAIRLPARLRRGCCVLAASEAAERSSAAAERRAARRARSSFVVAEGTTGDSTSSSRDAAAWAAARCLLAAAARGLAGPFCCGCCCCCCCCGR